MHHQSQEMKEVLGGAGVPLPLLSPTAHHGSACQGRLQPDTQKICDAYMEQVQSIQNLGHTREPYPNV